jgi:hypothetical protein
MFQYRKLTIPILITLSLSLTACSQRMPKPQTAQGIVKSYFKGYGKDYQDSDFGQHKVDKVEISSIKELQHEMVYVEAYVSLDEGEIVYKVGATLLKKTLFWKLISWENLGKAS